MASTTTIEKPATKPRGLAAVSPEKRREIARKGGRAAQANGNAHHWTPEEAAAAGKKGQDMRWQRVHQQIRDKEAQ